MGIEELATRYAEAMEAREAYVASLPAWVRLWLGWMSAVLPTCVLFVSWRAEARWTLLALLLSLAAANAIGMLFGWSRLWSLAHVLFWTPLVIYLARRWPVLSFRPRIRGRTRELTPLFRIWAALTLGTMGISLLFDFVDLVRFALTGH